MKKALFSGKTVLIIMCTAALAAWLFFPSTLYFSDWNKRFEVRDKNGRYTAVVYKKLPLSPYAMYTYFAHDDRYFIVLYDKGDYVWKNSPYTMISDAALSLGFSFPEDGDNGFVYPTDAGYGYVRIDSRG